jgi:myosin heavy subunit
MARPIAAPDMLRSVANGTQAGRTAPGLNGLQAPANGRYLAANGATAALSHDDAIELAQLRAENAQLHQLCVELEQALHESTQNPGGVELEARIKEFESLLEEKSQVIAEVHLQLQEARSLAEELQAQLSEVQPAGSGGAQGAAGAPAPREDELLALSEELERERRQLQEDEQSLMDQMRAMEVGMAKERAEMARQRNDLQRLQAEVRHEIDRHERNGALQSKIDSLKTRLQDTTARRGAAPAQSHQASPVQAAPAQPAPLPQSKGTSFMGRLFRK